MTITEPKELTYSHNPIIVKAESDQLATFDGAFYKVTIKFQVGFDNDGNFIPIYGADNSFQFGDFVFTGSSLESTQSEDSFYLNADYVSSGAKVQDLVTINSFVDFFNSNSNVNKKYFCKRVNFNTVEVRALNKGTRFNVSTAIVVNDGNGQLQFTPYLGTDSYFGDSKEGYGVFCEVYTGSISDFKNISTPEKDNFLKRADLLINYRKDNQYNFNLSEVLRAYVSKELPNVSNLYNFQEINTGYYCRVGQLYLVNATYRKRYIDTTTEAKSVMLGAIDLLNENDATIHYGQAVGSNIPLTNANYKPFYTSQSLLCFSFIKSDFDTYTSYNVVARYYLLDGTVQDAIILTIGTSYQNGLHTIYADSRDLQIGNIESAAGSEVEWFEVGLMNDANNFVTQTNSYRKFKEGKYHKKLAFRNRYGILDIYSFIGKEEFDTKTRLTNFSNTYPLTPAKTDKNLAVLRNETRKEFVYNSGYVQKDEFDNLIDLIKSIEVYVIDAEDRQALELEYVVPVEYSYEYNSDTDLYSVSLKVVRTILENNI